MKLVAIVDNLPSDGGGFNQAANSIIMLERMLNEKSTLLVLVTSKIAYEKFKELNLDVVYYHFGFFDRIYNFLARTLVFNTFIYRIKYLSRFEKFIIKNGCGLAYFVTPSAIACSLQKLNYIYTVWDMSYRINIEFPEVRELGLFKIKDSIYKFALERAFLIITSSEALSCFLCKNFSIPMERLLFIPLQVSPFLKLENKLIKNRDFLELKKQEYFFYPAQYWPHKNHIRILQALNFLQRTQKQCPTLVFSGADKGNLEWLKQYVEKENLGKNVIFFDYLNHDEFNYIYRNAHAIVMPTYFGPNNIVPLEAWTLEIPLIYSEGFEVEPNAGALLVNPDSYEELGNALLNVQKSQVRRKLIKQGQKVLNNHEKTVVLQERNLKYRLEIFEKRSETWESFYLD